MYAKTVILHQYYHSDKGLCCNNDITPTWRKEQEICIITLTSSFAYYSCL
jgi:hypothetical protein